jgi:hypothetical protein
VRRKAKANSVEYPPEFEAEWNQTSKTGAKDRALEFWERIGKPAFGAAWKRWQESFEWKQDWHNEPHVSTWLHDGRWKQEPPPPPPPKAAKDTRCAFHLNWANHGRRPPGGWYAECPECKHARAALTGRQGDAAPVRDLVAETEAKLASQRAVKPASSDELAKLRAEREQVRGPAEPRSPPPGVHRSPLSPALPGGNSADGSGTASGNLAGSTA